MPALGQNKIDSLKFLIKKVKSTTDSYKLDTLKANLYYEMAYEYYLKKNDGDSALLYSTNILGIANKYQWDKGFILYHTMQGNIAKLKGDYFTAPEHYFKALQVSEKNKYLPYIANSLYELGNCYYFLKDYIKAVTYYTKAKPIFIKIKNYNRAGLCDNNTGIVYTETQKYDKAFAVFDSAMVTFKKLNSDWAIANVFENIGLVHFAMKNYNATETNLLKAKDIFKTTNRPYFVAINFSRLGELYYEMGFNLKAIENCNNSIKISQKMGFESILIRDYDVLYKVYLRLGNEKRALENFVLMSKYKDKQNEQDLKKRIESLKFEYDNIKQKEQNLLQKKQLSLNTQITNYLSIGLCILLFFVLLLTFSLQKLQKQKLQIEVQNNEINLNKIALEELNQNLEQKVYERTKELSFANDELIRKNKEIEGALFKGQTIERKRIASELHDNLGGHISAVRWSLMALDKTKLSNKETKIYENIVSMMNSAYEEVRYISHNLLPEEFSKDGLIGTLNKLVNNLNQNRTISFTINSEHYQLQSESIELELYSIILEFLNNTIKHSKASWVEIYLLTTNEKTTVEIKDDDLSFNYEQYINSAKGKGLKNIKERLEKIDGNLRYLRFNNFKMVHFDIFSFQFKA